MGYRAEKEQIEKKIRVIKIVVLCVMVAIVASLCVFSAFCPPTSWKYYVKKPKLDKREDGELRIHFIDVGQGDSTLIELPDGKVALIDGGNTTQTTENAILRHLNALKIDTIDYLVVTHTDSDHCGSLAKILQYKKVLNAYLPATNPENAGEAYAKFYQELLEENSALHYAHRQVVLDGEGEYAYHFSFLYPYLYDTENAADYAEESSVMWLDYKGASAIFTGDAGMDVEAALVRDSELGFLSDFGIDLKSTEILKVGHHGSAYSTSTDFLRYLNVKIAVASCGEGNEYGHPSQEVIDRIADVGADLFRTDIHGTITVSVKESGVFTLETAK